MNTIRSGMKESRYRFIAAGLLLIVLVSIAFFIRGNSSAASKQQDWQKVFSLTVHAADGTPELVLPDSTASFGSYRITDSKAPGYPLIINAEGADKIKLSAGAGSIIRWDAPDYKVNNMGTEITVAPGKAVYWTPFVEEMPEMITESELTMSAYKGRSLISEARFLIQSDDQGAYSGRWVEKE